MDFMGKGADLYADVTARKGTIIINEFKYFDQNNQGNFIFTKYETEGTWGIF